MSGIRLDWRDVGVRRFVQLCEKGAESIRKSMCDIRFCIAENHKMHHRTSTAA
jgi:hypothetical protein